MMMVLFLILLPIYYLYILFKVVGPLVFIVTLVFPVLTVFCFGQPARDRGG